MSIKIMAIVVALAVSVALCGCSATGGAADNGGGHKQQPREVNDKVVVTANKPVIISVLTGKGMKVPLVSDKSRSATYTFPIKENVDIVVQATDPKLAVKANDEIHIKLYQNGARVAGDHGTRMAQVYYEASDVYHQGANRD